MNHIEDFVTLVRESYEHQDREQFSQLISIDETHGVVSGLMQALNQVNETQVEKLVTSQLEDTSFALSECIVNYLHMIRYLYDTDIEALFEKFATFYSSFIPVFNGSDTFYQVPVMNTLSTNLVELALSVDKTGLKGKARKANTAARLLSKVFNIMLADRSPIDSSKRQGIFHVTNLAFKVYFRLNSMRMCQTFISNIRTGGLDLDLFPISQQVTYKYYLGRYALYNGQLKKAQDCLLFAFQKCHIGHWHNKRVILHYLIPTRIILGHFPSLQLLETYELTAPYADLLKALRSGHLKGYLQHLETYFDYFYSHLTYLLLKERGIVLVWRCLIKNMYHQKQKLNQTIPVIEFRDCLKAFYFASPTGTSYTVEDMECILVSLVSQNYIRGYLQHSKQRLVLSKVNAFPPISHVRVHVERYNEAVLEDHMMHAQPPLPEEIQAYIDHE